MFPSPSMRPTQAFLDSLPALEAGSTFSFGCHPGVSCFNECCADLTLSLSPYDTLRLRMGLSSPSEPFLKKHTRIEPMPGLGLPLVVLKMKPERSKPCPFVSEEGCTVYLHRPGPCRMYPVGRTSGLDHKGRHKERFFLVREPHCKGSEQDRVWTLESWLADQGLDPYNRHNDRYMRILVRQKELGTPVEPRRYGMAVLALYQPDRFQRFVEEMDLFDRVDVGPERQQAIATDEEQALEFGMDWLELILFGENEAIKPRPNPSQGKHDPT